jgi:predicted Zn-dependent peptidase
MSPSDGIIAERPVPGEPRPYEFPDTFRSQLPNGLRLVVTPMAGRELVSASLVIRTGAADEPPSIAGATVLAARGLTEGTEVRDAIAMTEAFERLGASVHAEAGWDAMAAGLDVPESRLEPALELLAEVVRRPAFPTSEVERLRDERLNDLIQAKADPRRRAEEAFVSSIYAESSPYHRPAGGTPETVARLTSAELRTVHRSTFGPAGAALFVAGDVEPDAVAAMAGRMFGDWTGGRDTLTVPDAGSAVANRFIRVVHRPGAVQSEIRIGYPGIARKHPDFHAIYVMAMILGGLFSSRLMSNLREAKGYTYGAYAGFDVRRAAGPFAARAAVNTEVTVPSIRELLLELERMRDEPVSAAELRAAQNFIVGIFPLRFETPGPVVGSLSGLFTYDLPDDELGRYRPAIEAVTVEDVLRVAREHIHPERCAIVLVGDHDKFGADLEAAGIAPVEVITDEAEAPGRAG